MEERSDLSAVGPAAPRGAKWFKCAIASAVLVIAGGVSDRASANGLLGDMMPGPYDWSGLYIGGQVGYVRGDASYDVALSGASIAVSGDDVLGGAHVGYNWQNGDAVFGIVGDVNFTSLDGSSVVVLPTIATAVDYDVDLTASLRGKAGVLVTERVLLFATAGLAIADVDHSVAGGAILVGPFGPFDFSEVFLGFTVGGGIEMALTEWISTFVEYRFTKYGDESWGLVPLGGASFLAPHDFALETHQVQVGVSIHFNSWAGPGT